MATRDEVEEGDVCRRHAAVRSQIDSTDIYSSVRRRRMDCHEEGCLMAETLYQPGLCGGATVKRLSTDARATENLRHTRVKRYDTV